MPYDIKRTSLVHLAAPEGTLPVQPPLPRPH